MHLVAAPLHIGGIIMTHGDDAGLRLPPALAPFQVVVVPIAQKNKDKETVAAAAADIVSTLKAAGVRVKLDDDTRNSPGWKFNHWEMKGVPVRIEVGPKDVAKEACVLARRGRPFGPLVHSLVHSSVHSFVHWSIHLVHSLPPHMFFAATAFTCHHFFKRRLSPPMSVRIHHHACVPQLSAPSHV